MAVHIDPTGTRIVVEGPDGPLPTQGMPLVRLSSPAGATATIVPDVGFNLFDWRTPGGLALLHHESDVLVGGSGTRSGIPVLFPFPNRIAGAEFEWDGRTWSLPHAHPGDPNAIHGFCAKRPWSDYEASGESAVTGTFRLSRDAADVAADWPGDLELRLTYELGDRGLRLVAEVANVDDHPVPFGLGYHPYFSLLGCHDLADVDIQVGADSFWPLHDSIPEGTVSPVTGDRDLRVQEPVGERVLDDVLTGLPPFEPGPDGLMRRAVLSGCGATVDMRYDSAFRDIVVFTPGNRASIAVEPYTCPTDAVHLQGAGQDVGWRSLGAGETWRSVVEFVVRH